MMRLGISVEGATDYQIYASPVGLRGRVSLERIGKELRALLKQFDRVTTFYDYYGFHKRPPGKVETLEAAILELVEPESQQRLIPYVQQYEFEALVLAAPDAAEKTLGVAGLKQTLEQLTKQYGGAEQVNDGYDTCPSRRIKAQVPAYDKKLHGPVILQDSLAEVREQCPRFNQWVSQLAQLS
ncbi:DUF4276 family protein [Marinospirillum sp.]|uniref:DUF4276 family protein n=1 Tax=Marinospirillum sp. TaxID=2183934 RepID=UPI00384B45F3